MYPLSSNAFSVDDQIRDAINALSDDDRANFDRQFPEFATLTWSGSWVDTEASGVDVEYMSWAADWLEANTPVFWEEGEPWMREDSDDEDYIDPDDEPETITDDIDFSTGTRVLAHGRGKIVWTVEHIVRMPNGDESVIAHMVGDDRPEPFNRDDLTVYQEPVCDCGQADCGWGLTSE